MFITPVMSYFLHRSSGLFLTMSYNKDKNEEVVYDDKVMIKNYSLRFFDKELGAR